MTAQVREIVVIDGERRGLCALPLAPLFHSWRPEIRFEVESSANWRGYQGSWEIVGTDLFLTDFTGTPVQNGDPKQPGPAALPIIAHGPDVANEKAVARWKKAVAHLDGLPKDANGESVPDRSSSPVHDDDGFVSGGYRGEVDLEAVVNARRSPVFASWFTGVLRMPQGKTLEYVHGGFGSLQERDLIVSIESGVVARRWMLNYIPAFFAEKPAEAREAYSLIAMKPRLRPDAAKRAVRYLANPFSDNFADALSEVYWDKMSSLYSSLFMVSDLVKVVIRTGLLEGLDEEEALSKRDRAARCQYDKTVEAFARALSTAETLLRGERRGVPEIPNDHEGSLDWSTTVLRNVEAQNSSENLLHLGLACRLVENELRRRAR